MECRWNDGKGRVAMQKFRGFTLVDLLVTLTISVILLSGGVGLATLADSARTDTIAQSLIRLTATARTVAIHSGERVTLCGTYDLTTCSRDWNQSTVMVFIDTNQNFQRDSNESILHQISFAHGHAHWNGSRPLMRYRPDGTAIDFGTYVVCPTNNDNRAAFEMTINAAGRSYLSHDRDGDGIDEGNVSGVPIDCAAI